MNFYPLWPKKEDVTIFQENIACLGPFIDDPDLIEEPPFVSETAIIMLSAISKYYYQWGCPTVVKIQAKVRNPFFPPDMCGAGLTCNVSLLVIRHVRIFLYWKHALLVTSRSSRSNNHQARDTAYRSNKAFPLISLEFHCHLTDKITHRSNAMKGICSPCQKGCEKCSVWKAGLVCWCSCRSTEQQNLQILKQNRK